MLLHCLLLFKASARDLWNSKSKILIILWQKSMINKVESLIFKAVIISVISLCKVDDCIKLPACRLFHHTWKRLLLKQLFHLFHIRFMGSDQVYQLVDKFIFFFMFMNINTCFFRKEQTI